MEALLYFLKSSIILAIFYGVYFLFMRKDTLFAAKRFFFITGLMTALILPFLKFSKITYIDAPVFSATPMESIDFNNVEIITTAAKAPVLAPIDWWQIALICYMIIATVLALRFFTQLFTLYLLFKKTPSVRRNGYQYIEVADAISPFSFFNYIVYNPELHTQEELRMILAHEQIHGKQLHSLDMFLSQLITIIQWANPFSWLYKKALEANLEFVADAQTIPKIESKKQYQLTLVKASSSLPAPALTSPFYQSLIKKRILMLNKTTTHKRNLFKMTFVLPLLAFFFLSFNMKEEIAYNEPAELTSSSLIITSETLDTEIKSIEKAINSGTSAFEVDFTDVLRDTSGNITQLAISTRFATRKSFTKNVTYGGDNVNIPSLKLSVEEDQLHFSDIEETTLMQITATGVKALTFPKKEIAPTSNEKMGENPLYIINGEELFKSALPAGASFEVSDNIEMLYPSKATTRYGVKGKDGAYVFNGVTTFNKEAPLTNTKVEKEESNHGDTRPKFNYHITKNTTDAEFEQIKKELKEEHNTVFEYAVTRNVNNEITSITITHSNNKGNSGSYNVNDTVPISDIYFYKNEDEIGLGALKRENNRSYHFDLEESRKGLAEKRRELSTKKMAEKRALKSNKMNNRRNYEREIESIHIDHDGDTPIVILNGKVYHGDINTIDPDNIATVNVIKNESALNKYGKNAKNGVIEIHLKDGVFKTSSWTSNTTHTSNENIYITKNTSDSELAMIKNEMKKKGFDFKYKRVRRNNNNEITGIKIDFNNGMGDKSVISKKSSTPIEDILIEI